MKTVQSDRPCVDKPTRLHMISVSSTSDSAGYNLLVLLPNAIFFYF